MVMYNEVKHAMGMIKKIDSIPKDDMMVLYVNGRINHHEFEQLRTAVQSIREDDDVKILVLPQDELELMRLTRDEVNRMITTLQRLTPSED